MLLKMAANSAVRGPRRNPKDHHCHLSLPSWSSLMRPVTYAGQRPSLAGHLAPKMRHYTVPLMLISTDSCIDPVRLLFSYLFVPERPQCTLSCLRVHYYTSHTVSELLPPLCQHDEWWQRSQSRLFVVCVGISCISVFTGGSWELFVTQRLQLEGARGSGSMMSLQTNLDFDCHFNYSKAHG